MPQKNMVLPSKRPIGPTAKRRTRMGSVDFPTDFAFSHECWGFLFVALPGMLVILVIIAAIHRPIETRETIGQEPQDVCVCVKIDVIPNSIIYWQHCGNDGRRHHCDRGTERTIIYQCLQRRPIRIRGGDENGSRNARSRTQPNNL